MCGRYYIEEDSELFELESIVREAGRRAPEGQMKTRGEVFPSDVVPVLAYSKSMVQTAFPMKWGYALSSGKLLINVRSETASEKPMFRESMARHRCAVPASCYFEWERRGREKIKYAIRPREAGIMYLAGIYRLEGGKPVFSVLTREPADPIRFIHDRMPVILPPERIGEWMNPTIDAQETLQRAVLDVEPFAADLPRAEQLSALD
ncbi:MAG: SOS response-associated peptidase [Clostridia bacterium]|nr:SOS response-associated peptidase [Clostridia bacterium]